MPSTKYEYVKPGVRPVIAALKSPLVGGSPPSVWYVPVQVVPAFQKKVELVNVRPLSCWGLMKPWTVSSVVGVPPGSAKLVEIVSSTGLTPVVVVNVRTAPSFSHAGLLARWPNAWKE